MYRELGKTGKNVSTIGFGCMRFETIDNDNSRIDEPKAIELIRSAIDNGLNYLDTAWPYHGGTSEALVAKAVKDGYREKTFIATKLPAWLIKTREDMDHYLNEQLKRLEIDSIDFYLIHALDKKRWDDLLELGITDFMDTVRKDGRVKHIGFSFHDNLEAFKAIVDGYDWEFTQIQLNLVDGNHQQGLEGMYYAREKGLGIIIMEPLRGGVLGNPEKVPEEVLALYGDTPPVEWAMKYIMNFSEVDLVLSGMNRMEHIMQNIDLAKQVVPGSVTDEEKAVLNKAQKIYLDKILVHCTACQYCMPCPHGVDIPANFRYHNESNMLDFDTAKYWYDNNVKSEARADQCTECGQCEPLCPQNIAIIDELKNVTARLG